MDKYNTESIQKYFSAEKVLSEYALEVIIGNELGPPDAVKNAVIWESLRNCSTDVVHLLHSLED